MLIIWAFALPNELTTTRHTGQVRDFDLSCITRQFRRYAAFTPSAFN